MLAVHPPLLPHLPSIARHLQSPRSHKPLKNFWAAQPFITKSMRSTLLEWLLEITIHLEFRQNTFVHCAQLIDRFLSIQSVSKENFQKLGIVMMQIASKLLEQVPLEVGEMVHVCDGIYTAKEFVECEAEAARVLRWELGGSSKKVQLDFLLLQQGY